MRGTKPGNRLRPRAAPVSYQEREGPVGHPCPGRYRPPKIWSATLPWRWVVPVHAGRMLHREPVLIIKGRFPVQPKPAHCRCCPPGRRTARGRVGWWAPVCFQRHIHPVPRPQEQGGAGQGPVIDKRIGIPAGDPNLAQGCPLCRYRHNAESFTRSRPSALCRASVHSGPAHRRTGIQSLGR